MNFVASFTAARIVMVKDQLCRRGIHDERVLEAFRNVPREKFVLPEDAPRAYDDAPLKIGCAQTISQPYIVALTCQSLELAPRHRVLEIGTGSGYQTAILSRLCEEVISIERLPELLKEAQRRIDDLEIKNTRLILADGTLGAQTHAPFDAVAVTAAAPRILDSLVSQLAPGGRIVIPVGDRVQQELFLLRKNGESISRTKLCDCRFVPLIGLYGFETEAAS